MKDKNTLHDLYEQLKQQLAEAVAERKPGKITIEINLGPEGGITMPWKFGFTKSVK